MIIRRSAEYLIKLSLLSIVTPNKLNDSILMQFLEIKYIKTFFTTSLFKRKNLAAISF